MKNQKYKTILSYSDIKQILELIESNNQYNEDESEKKSWEVIASKFRQSEEV